MKQQENVKALIKAISENPDLPVRFMVNGDELSEHTYTVHHICSVGIHYWIEEGDRIFTDYNEYIEHLVDYEGMYETDEEAEEKHPIETFPKAIVVFTCA